MGIFLRQSYNVKPLRWGSAQDVEYAVRVNAEKIYDVDPDSIVLAMPLFFGLPCLDYSGKRNDGVNHGAYYKDGELEFDGSDYVDCGISSNFAFDESSLFTIESWIKTTDTGANKVMVGLQKSSSANANDVIVLQHNNGVIYFYIIEEWSAKSIQAFAGSGFNDGAWHHVVVTYNGNGNGSGVAIYVDGTSLSVTVGIDGLTSGFEITDKLAIGQNSHWGSAFNGSINETKIYNRSHSADQIALFHALPYGLYQPVIRPIYFFIAAAIYTQLSLSATPGRRYSFAAKTAADVTLTQHLMLLGIG